MPDCRREDRTIEQFVSLLSKIEHDDVKIVARPDCKNPGRGGCDAIIQGGGGRYALERTTIDSYTGQRFDDDRFREFIRVPLEDAVRSAYRDSYIEIVVPANALRVARARGRLPEIRDSLVEAGVRQIAEMPFSDELSEFHFPGVPFPVRISRSEDRATPDCCPCRQTPANLEEQLKSDMERAIRDKSKTLTPYKQHGSPTILLLDSNDVALVNHRSLADAFSKAAQSQDTAVLDEVFIAVASRRLDRRTEEPMIWFFPVKLRDRFYPNLPEFEQFRKLQHGLTYGKIRTGVC